MFSFFITILFCFALTQVTAVIVTELDIKLRPLFMLTWRVADLQKWYKSE